MTLASIRRHSCVRTLHGLGAIDSSDPNYRSRRPARIPRRVYGEMVEICRWRTGAWTTVARLVEKKTPMCGWRAGLADAPANSTTNARVLDASANPPRWTDHDATAAAARTPVDFLAEWPVAISRNCPCAAAQQILAPRITPSGDAESYRLAGCGGARCRQSPIRYRGVVRGWPKRQTGALEDAGDETLVKLFNQATPASRSWWVWPGGRGPRSSNIAASGGGPWSLSRRQRPDAARIAAAGQSIISAADEAPACRLDLCHRIIDLAQGLVETGASRNLPAGTPSSSLGAHAQVRTAAAILLSRGDGPERLVDAVESHDHFRSSARSKAEPGAHRQEDCRACQTAPIASGHDRPPESSRAADQLSSSNAGWQGSSKHCTKCRAPGEKRHMGPT